VQCLLSCPHCATQLTVLLQLTSADGGSLTYVFVCTYERCSHTEPRFFRVIRTGCEAPLTPSKSSDESTLRTESEPFSQETVPSPMFETNFGPASNKSGTTASSSCGKSGFGFDTGFGAATSNAEEPSSSSLCTGGFGFDTGGFGDSSSGFGVGDEGVDANGFGTCGDGFKDSKGSSWLDNGVDDVSVARKCSL